MQPSSPTSIPRHDLPHGHLDKCQICGSGKLTSVLDLGHQPPCDSLLTAAQLNVAESTYPLRLLQCRDCGLAQIDYAVSPEILFHPDYPYRSGITATLVRNLQGTASTIVDAYHLSVTHAGSVAPYFHSNLQAFDQLGRHGRAVTPRTSIAKILDLPPDVAGEIDRADDV